MQGNPIETSLENDPDEDGGQEDDHRIELERLRVTFIDEMIQNGRSQNHQFHHDENVVSGKPEVGIFRGDGEEHRKKGIGNENDDPHEHGDVGEQEMGFFELAVEEGEKEKQPNRQKHERRDERAGIRDVEDDADSGSGLAIKHAGDGIGDGRQPGEKKHQKQASADGGLFVESAIASQIANDRQHQRNGVATNGGGRDGG